MLRSTVSRTARWLMVATLVAISGRLLAQVPADFSVVLLPDTQFYSENHPTIFTQQTRWIVNNRTTWNIQFVIGEGDIVNTPSNNFEWVNADTSIKVLDNAGMPYVLAIGNHDYDDILPSARGTVAYNKWFGVSRYSKYPWYLGHLGTTNENFYATFTVSGQRYIVMALEYYPRDSALSWAESVMQANSDAKVIVTTHSFVFTDGTRGDVCDTNDMRGSSGRNAETSWEQTLKEQPNLQLVVSGHLVSTNSAYRSDLGTNGNLVNQIFTNFQNWTNGGNGYLRILKFRPSTNTIEVYTYSPTLNKFLTDPVNQFNLKITNDGNTATTGAISGKVRTSSCTLIGGATVTAGTANATSDANGRYTISNLPEGEYTVTVSANGFTVPNKTSVVYNGFNTQTDFYPTPQSTLSCTLNKTDPSVTICLPAANSAVSSPVHFQAGTTASAGVTYMQIYVDSIKQLTVNAASIDTSLPETAGTHRLTIQAKLKTGTIVKNTISFKVGSGGGGGGGGTSTVIITSPVNGSTVSSPVPVKATATSSVAISYMQLYIDGVKKFQVNGSSMNTTAAMAAGAHRVTVQAKDASGTLLKTTVNITVK